MVLASTLHGWRRRRWVRCTHGLSQEQQNIVKSLEFGQLVIVEKQEKVVEGCDRAMQQKDVDGTEDAQHAGWTQDGAGWAQEPSPVEEVADNERIETREEEVGFVTDDKGEGDSSATDADLENDSTSPNGSSHATVDNGGEAYDGVAANEPDAELGENGEGMTDSDGSQALGDADVESRGELTDGECCAPDHGANTTDETDPDVSDESESVQASSDTDDQNRDGGTYQGDEDYEEEDYEEESYEDNTAGRYQSATCEADLLGVVGICKGAEGSLADVYFKKLTYEADVAQAHQKSYYIYGDEIRIPSACKLGEDAVNLAHILQTYTDTEFCFQPDPTVGDVCDKVLHCVCPNTALADGQLQQPQDLADLLHEEVMQNDPELFANGEVDLPIAEIRLNEGTEGAGSIDW